MKLIIIGFFILLIHNVAFSQNEKAKKKMADAAVEMFTWDLMKSEKGTLMVLDVPFLRDGHKKEEYLTLSVAKDTGKARPTFISVIVPNNIVQSNGIFISFANTIKTRDGMRSMEMQKDKPVRLLFESCNKEDCTGRIMEGYANQENDTTKVDIFQKLLDFDHVLFLIIYSDKTHKSIAVPLSFFKEQYKTLK